MAGQSLSSKWPAAKARRGSMSFATCDRDATQAPGRFQLNPADRSSLSEFRRRSLGQPRTLSGQRFAAWITDCENFIWPLTANGALEEAVQNFEPDVVLTLAECGLSQIARKTAQRHGLPLAGLFLDWFPVTKGHYGHKWTRGILSRRYRELYAACDLAFCTSDGMQEMLGPHPNSHVVYPMPGK